jgi:hypothetical protein
MFDRKIYMKKYDKRRYHNNKKKELARRKKYYLAHKSQELKKRHIRYMKKKEEIKAKKNAWYRKNRKRLRKSARLYQKRYPAAVRGAQLKYMYGITIDEYNNLLNKQHNRCAICGMTNMASKKLYHKYLSVDHCHITNMIRGLLCDDCNNGLGRFKDSANLLSKALLYLRKVKKYDRT